MAIIKCPECEREISDSLNACPHCGFVLKAQKKSHVGRIIIAVLAILAVAGGALYFLYIKPNSIMNQAENLIGRGKYAEADVLLASVADGDRKSDLLAKVNVGEAREALNSGDLDQAQNILKKVPEDKIPEDITQTITERRADALIEEGKYTEADELFAALPQTEEVVAKRSEINMTAANKLVDLGRYAEADELFAKAEQTEEIIEKRKSLFYESRVFQCALMVKDNLLFPESMTVAEAVLFSGQKRKDNEKSTDENEVYNYDQPRVLLHYRAKTRGGSIKDSYERFTWNGNDYSGNISVDSLETDSQSEMERKTKYMDFSDSMEYLDGQREIAEIRLMLIFPYEAVLEDEQLERINNTLQIVTDKAIDIIPNNEIVPLPTPEIVSVTPAPTEVATEAAEAVEGAAEAATDAVEGVTEAAEEAVEAAEAVEAVEAVEGAAEAATDAVEGVTEAAEEAVEAAEAATEAVEEATEAAVGAEEVATGAAEEASDAVEWATEAAAD